MEPQQSELYKKFMLSLKWDVMPVGEAQVFIRSFPIVGGMMKLHRPQKLPNTVELISLIKQRRIHTLVVEPVLTQDPEELQSWCEELSKQITISSSPFLPTKTIHIDVTRNEDAIFSSFSEAKRRAVRRATKLGVTIQESDSIRDLLNIKNKSAGLFGFMTTSGMKELWDVFAPTHASILLAHDEKKVLLGGVLLLHYDNVTYYWIAGTITHGKKLFAPTLLVWESIKLAKQKKSKIFDFVGVWDERLPKENTQWLGFTKFKEGFGGKTAYYPLVVSKYPHIKN